MTFSIVFLFFSHIFSVVSWKIIDIFYLLRPCPNVSVDDSLGFRFSGEKGDKQQKEEKKKTFRKLAWQIWMKCASCSIYINTFTQADNEWFWHGFFWRFILHIILLRVWMWLFPILSYCDWCCRCCCLFFFFPIFIMFGFHVCGPELFLRF